MATTARSPKLLVIAGPTASGKSALAIHLAKELNGEIIAADSRTIYKGMDVGTAKPDKVEQEGVRHWGFDLVEPGRSFSAHQFKLYAKQKIKEIELRHKLPILVGGTGLYADGVLFDYQFRPAADAKLRTELEKLSTGELQARVAGGGFEMSENRLNRRHLIRALETGGQASERRTKPIAGSLLIGLKLPSDELKRRIEARAKTNFGRLIDETDDLIKTYGETALRRTAGIPYLAAIDFLSGKIDKNDAIAAIKSAEWQYVRRQRTWFKRNPFINWFESARTAENFILKHF